MNDQHFEEQATNIVFKGCVFIIMLGSLGLIRLFQNPQIRAKALAANSKGFLGRLFDFRGTAGRLEYLGIQLAAPIIASVPASFIDSFFNQSNESLEILFLLILVLPLTAILLAVSARRCRDLSLSPWILILLPVPMIGGMVVLTFLFFPGGYKI